ncbi:Gfo/Idh/MocA family protein [Micromonospora sp. DT81.3]|uniref:Gfo/Idh/MocA family protein n=1 Tax=Micromonospora sp. DT81.3 TaxID=3416523 RepID=UPI003CE6B6BB
MTITSAIVGTGAIAHAHAEALLHLGDSQPGCTQPEGARLVGVVDLDPTRARDFAERFAVPATYGSVAELLEQTRPDYVHICTPPGSHVPLAIEVLRGGSVPIIEKPPALSLAELDRLHTVELETGISAIGLFQQRFGAGAEALRSALAEGLLGRPLVAVCETLWYRDEDYFAVPWRGKWDVEGGGPTMGHGIHQMDLLLSVLGPWSTVRAVAARQARTTQTEDVSAAIVTFENGAIATVLNSLVSPSQVSRLRFDFENATAELVHLYGYDAGNWSLTPAPGSEALAETWAERATGVPSGHAAQFGAIVAAREAGTPAPVTITDARETLSLAAALYASAFTDTTIAAGDIGPGHPFYESMEGTGAPWAAVSSAAAAAPSARREAR